MADLVLRMLKNIVALAIILLHESSTHETSTDETYRQVMAGPFLGTGAVQAQSIRAAASTLNSVM